jgi:ribosomal protein L19E
MKWIRVDPIEQEESRAAASSTREQVEELVEGVLEHLAFVFQKRRRSRTSALAASSRKHREKARASGSIFEHTTTSEIDHIGSSARQLVSSAIR